MAMTHDNIFFKRFWESLREDQKKEYQDMSINQQKDWYISYLEWQHSRRDLKLAQTLFTSETEEEFRREFEGESDEEIRAEREGK